MITQQQSQYTQDLIDGLQENGDPVSVEAAQELQNLQRFRETVQEVMGCFNAAEIEGLSKALQETDDLHLKDLVERRLMYAFYAAEQAASDCELDEDQQEAQAAQQSDREPCGWRKKYNGEWAYAFSEDAWEFIRRGTPASGQSPDAPKRVMKVVPAEPTEEMISAANRTCRNDEQCKAKWEPSNCKLCRDDTAEDLRAALKVAPHETPCTTLSDEDKAILEAVRRELDDGDRKNAPGHAHQIPGIWDSDNGKKAGKPCAWCLTWSKFTALIDRDTSSNKQESP